jgi:hypothetical protein
MVAEEPAAAITDQDIRSLSATLKGLHALLTAGEQRLLQETLSRAAQRADVAAEAEAAAEVEGYDWAVRFNPLSYLDAIAREII